MNDDYIRQSEDTVETLTSENAKLREENEALKNENESLKKKIILYDDPRTPPSRQMFPLKVSNPPGK